MKKIVISVFAVLSIVLVFLGIAVKPKKSNAEYLRIHIRANSNSEEDQNVKYKIRDKVIELLTPYIANCETKEKAQEVLSDLEREIEKTADEVLQKSGYTYKSDAVIKEEIFPTRTYDKLTLDGGFYDALIINLGSGKGDNWWCVVYPPLCFVGEGTNYVYKSKIIEIISDFKNRIKGS